MQSCFIYACTIVSNQKASVSKKGMRPQIPWEVVALGLTEPYPRSSQGKTGILIVTDLLTRLVKAFAIPGRIVSCIHHVLQGGLYPLWLPSMFTVRQWDKNWFRSVEENSWRLRNRAFEENAHLPSSGEPHRTKEPEPQKITSGSSGTWNPS